MGKGSIHVMPDVTRIEATVNSVFDTYAEAYKQAKDNASWTVKVLEYNQLDGKLAKTVRFDISDYTVGKYDDDDHYIGHEKVGYSLNQCIKVDIGIDNVLLNRIVRGVGKFIPDVQINIGYTLQDPRPTELKMLKRAVTDARDKAEIMAEALGCKLGGVH